MIWHSMGILFLDTVPLGQKDFIKNKTDDPHGLSKNKSKWVKGQTQDILFRDSCQIIEEARDRAYHAVNIELTIRNWRLGEQQEENE